MAVPTRTRVAPSAMATSKSSLIPMDRCDEIDVRPPAGRLPIAKGAERGEVRARVFGRSPERRDQHEPLAAHVLRGGESIEQCGQSVRRNTPLGGLASYIHLHEARLRDARAPSMASSSATESTVWTSATCPATYFTLLL